MRARVCTSQRATYLANVVYVLGVIARGLNAVPARVYQVLCRIQVCTC